MTSKPFDKNLFEQNDALAKENVQRIIGQFPELELRASKSRYGVDFLLYKNGEHIANIETEIKRVWEGERFIYDTVQFPLRKAKFAQLEKPTYFIMFNKDCSHYLVVTSKALLESPKTEVHNKYVRSGEFFFQVPIDKVIFDSFYV